MSVPGPPPKAPRTPKGDGEHYKSGLQKFVRRAFDVLLSAAGLLGIHGLIHFLLFALGVDTTEPIGKFVDKSVPKLRAIGPKSASRARKNDVLRMVFGHNKSVNRMAQTSKIDPDPKTDPETSVEQLSPAWAASVVRIATVWGLGVGTAIALCLYAVLALHLGAGKFGIGLVLGFASGLMLAVGMAYQTYVQRHLRVIFTSDLRGGALASAFLGAAMLFVTATLFVMLSPPFLLGFALFLRNADHRALTWRQRRETYIGGLMPHVRAF